MTRLTGLITHNWPLKLAAIALATVLYAGLALSQNARVWPGRVPIETVNQPTGAFLLENLGDVTTIRYYAPADVAARISSGDFQALVDLSSVTPAPGGAPVSVPVQVIAARPAHQGPRLSARSGAGPSRPGHHPDRAHHGRARHGPAWPADRRSHAQRPDGRRARGQLARRAGRDGQRTGGHRPDRHQRRRRGRSGRPRRTRRPCRPGRHRARPRPRDHHRRPRVGQPVVARGARPDGDAGVRLERPLSDRRARRGHRPRSRSTSSPP